MTRIGLISDTHNYLDDAVFRHFEHCDEIWHAGDFGTTVIADALKAFKPLRGVYGNIDGYDIRSEFPETMAWQSEKVKILMMHIGGYPPKYNSRSKAFIKESHPQIFVSGHSHILRIIYDNQLNCLYMNPGAAGKEGWHKIRTLVRFVIDGKDIRDCEIIELGKK